MGWNPDLLRVLRERSGLAQAELARRSGVSQGHISQLEAGDKTPRPLVVHTDRRAGTSSVVNGSGCCCGGWCGLGCPAGAKPEE